MKIGHGQFLQDVEVIEMMYQSCDGLRHDGVPKGRQWLAAMASGPMGQIQETTAEMHEYLRIPDPLPAVPLPADADPPPGVTDRLQFQTALTSFLRLYRGLGEFKKEIGQYHPNLYAKIANQVIPQMHAVRAALHAYLAWDQIEQTLDEMEQQFANTSANGAPADATPEPAAEPRK